MTRRSSYCNIIFHTMLRKKFLSGSSILISFPMKAKQRNISHFKLFLTPYRIRDIRTSFLSQTSRHKIVKTTNVASHVLVKTYNSISLASTFHVWRAKINCIFFRSFSDWIVERDRKTRQRKNVSAVSLKELPFVLLFVV